MDESVKEDWSWISNCWSWAMGTWGFSLWFYLFLYVSSSPYENEKNSNSHHAFCWYHINAVNARWWVGRSPSLWKDTALVFPMLWAGKGEKNVKNMISRFTTPQWCTAKETNETSLLKTVWGENTSLFWNMSPELWISSSIFLCGSPSGFSDE